MRRAHSGVRLSGCSLAGFAPSSAGPPDAIDHGERLAWDRISALGNVLIRANEDEIVFIEPLGVGVANADDVEGETAIGCGLDEGSGVGFAKTKQGEVLAEPIAECASVFQA